MFSLFRETVVNTAHYAELIVRNEFQPPGRSKPRVNPTQVRVVMVIPGFLGPRAVTRPLQIYFEKHGIPAFGFNLGLYSALPFGKIMQKLTHRISKVRQASPWLRRIDIVGHSMGGLLAAQAIREGVLDGLETRFVGIGTPFRGTYAALTCVMIPGAYDLLPFHRRYHDLIAQTWLEQISFLSISGGFDVLAPPDRCRHPLAENMIMPDVDHAGLLIREDVFAAVYDFLARPI